LLTVAAMANSRLALGSKSSSTEIGISSQQDRIRQNNNGTPDSGKGVNIALVEPTFTEAAYNNAFYIFYAKYVHTPLRANVTSNLNLLSTRVTNDSPTTTKTSSAVVMYNLLKHLNWLTKIDNNVTVLTDQDVDNGSIFERQIYNGSVGVHGISSRNAFDVIILGHQEYVTQTEYDNLKLFVANGGTIFIMDGNVFYAEVKYDRTTNTITLVKGHGWAFNGQSAWRSVAERWAKETSQWVGSNYLCYSCNIRFTNDPFEYRHHEEQYVTNPKDLILMDYKALVSNYPKPIKPTIAVYELNYQKGKVIAFGIYSEDIIFDSEFNKYFHSLVLQFAE